MSQNMTISAKELSKSHLSVQRNPVIADVFNRTGLIEKWGRGTNRVIAMCREAGISPPIFEEITEAAVVTFKVNVLGSGRKQTQPDEQVGEQVGEQVIKLLNFCQVGRSTTEMLAHLGLVQVYLNYKRHVLL